MIGTLKGRFKSLVTDDDGKTSISFEIDNKPLAQAITAEIKGLPENKRALTIQIEKYRKDRTAEQNALLWKLLEIMAEELHCTKYTAYEMMLCRYGVSEFYAVPPEAVDSLRRVYRVVKTLQPCKLNRTDGVAVKCVLGSSHYDTKEMTTLIDGVFDELKGMEIDTAELWSYREQWSGMCSK